VFTVGLAVVSGAPPSRADGPWPLGTLQINTGTVGDCPSGFVCQPFRIDQCPNVTTDVTGEVAQTAPAGTPRGVVVLVGGGAGGYWWARPGPETDYLLHLRDDDGFVIVEVQWKNGWSVAPTGDPVGPAHLACKTATFMQWVHDTIYVPLGLSPWAGQCGFCITGNSGGAAAVSYPLAFYGLDGILDAVIPTGGPGLAAITKGCLQEPGYGFDTDNVQSVDAAYGYTDPVNDPGPCTLQDAAWRQPWDADSVDLGGNDYDHPGTRIEFLLGANDTTAGPSHAADHRDRLLQDPANPVTWTVVPFMAHHIQGSPTGQAALEASLLKAIGPTTTITDGPADPTNQTSATFVFSADDPAATFTCQLDGDAAQPCASPVSYGGLASGEHSFSVQGADGLGQLGPAASWAWTVEVGPATTITHGPADPTNQTSATFDFSADDPGATFTCQLDGAAAQPCASPVSYGGLADGVHVEAVQATNGSGQTGLPATWSWTVDTAAPTLLPGGPAMLDTDHDGRVDQVVATFSEPLGPYTAGTAPWTLANVPSGGSIASVSVSGSTVTISLSEGAGAPDTSVGAFTVALAAAAGGVADPAGNQASFGAMAPVDQAAPVPVTLSNRGGSKPGFAQPGDRLLVTFSEPLLASSVPSTTTASEADPSGAGDDLLLLTGVTKGGLDTGSDGYVTLDGAKVRFAGSTLALSAGNTLLTLTVGPKCSGSCGARGQSGPAPFAFAPNPAVTDPAGNAAAGSLAVTTRLF